MRASMWSSYLIELSPEEMVRTFAGHGWQCAELSDEHGRMLLERGDPAKVGAAFRAFADNEGFAFPQGHLLLRADIAHPDDAVRAKIMDELKRWYDLFAGVGVVAAVLHPGGQGLVDTGWERERIVQRRIEGLEALAAFAAGGATTICLENDRPVGELAELVHLIDSAKGIELGICLDTGHLNRDGGDCAAFVRGAGGRLRALHVTDSIGRHRDHMLPYGPGTVDWAGFVAALREIGYEGLFNFEVSRESKCPMPIRLAKLDYARQLARLMIGA